KTRRKHAAIVRISSIFLHKTLYWNGAMGKIAEQMERENQQNAIIEANRDKGNEKKKRAKGCISLGESDGWRIGDRCLLPVKGKSCTAIVRWIGELPGHVSVYAGIEFLEPCGNGNGSYRGKELFQTAPDHAGFVMLSSLSPLAVDPKYIQPAFSPDIQRDLNQDGTGPMMLPSPVIDPKYIQPAFSPDFQQYRGEQRT
ncbi:hypothetical protein PFISCL1PPCAC_6758, partial [Pristionchus fissidentatus]